MTPHRYAPGGHGLCVAHVGQADTASRYRPCNHGRDDSVHHLGELREVTTLPAAVAARKLWGSVREYHSAAELGQMLTDLQVPCVPDLVALATNDDLWGPVPAPGDRGAGE